MRAKSLVLAVSFLLSGVIPAAADDVITISLSRAPLPGFGGTLQQSYILVTASKSPPASPTICYVLSPGGRGKLGVAVTGNRLSVNQTNFLVRSRHLLAGAAQLGRGNDQAKQGSCVAVLDAATDFLSQPSGLLTFRRSPERIGDIAAVIADLRGPGKFGSELRIVLVGTSRGTIDVTEAATQLVVDALVLTSTVTRPGLSSPDNVFDVDLSLVQVPTALFFHKDDACSVTPPEDVKPLKAQLVNVPRVRVRGFKGGFLPVNPNPCQATTFHGFLGKEPKVMREIVKFVNKVIDGDTDDDDD